jgi:virulence-associated protein VagC
MKTKIITIDHNQAITIPPEILKNWEGIDTVDIQIENNYLIVYPIIKPRHNWEEQFKQNDDIINEWDQEEWQW